MARDKLITTRVSTCDKDAVKRLADREGVSLSALVAYLIQQAIRSPAVAPKRRARA